MVHCIFDYWKLQIKNKYLLANGSSKIVLSSNPRVNIARTQCYDNKQSPDVRKSSN
jgi:hypothetical protein